MNQRLRAGLVASFIALACGVSPVDRTPAGPPSGGIVRTLAAPALTSLVATLQAQSATWVNVTPGGINLASSSNGGDNFGVQDVYVDPAHPNVLYAWVCYQGVWKSSDYGLTWAKTSTAGGPLDFGKPWGEAMAPDGSYGLATSGNNSTGTPTYGRTVLKSTDFITWTQTTGNLGADPYDMAICPTDKTRVVMATHETDQVFESTDSGGSFTSVANVGGGSTSGYVEYLNDCDTIIYVGQTGESVVRCTKSGTWSCAGISDLANSGHDHGVYQGYHDTANGVFYHGAGGQASVKGIFRSTNGTSWTRVFSTQGSSTITGTPGMLFSMNAFPVGSNHYDPQFTTATNPPGTSWAAPSQPSGLDNGAKRLAITCDGSHYIVVGGMWNAGIWRYETTETCGTPAIQGPGRLRLAP